MGITTVANMTFALEGQTMTEAVAREMAEAAAEAAVDWFLHPVLAGLGTASPPRSRRWRPTGTPASRCSCPTRTSRPERGAWPTPIAAAGRVGALTLVHCEDAGMLTHAGDQLLESGRGAVRNFPEARPVSAEVEAVEQAISLCRLTGAPIYIVHLSSAAAPRPLPGRRAPPGCLSTWRPGRCTCT